MAKGKTDDSKLNKKPKSIEQKLKLNKNKKKIISSDDKDATIAELLNGTLKGEKKIKKKRDEKVNDSKNKIKNNEKEEEVCKFPQSRIRRIIKSDDSSVHISEETVFLINKASEKFLELFCKEAFACTAKEKKKHVEYKHLSSVVSKQERFDFLSDSVPEKVKAEVALAETSSAKTSEDPETESGQSKVLFN